MSSKLTAGAMIFKIVNGGQATHSFKICSSPTTNVTANVCLGKTARIAEGGTVSLAITLKQGKYEYLSTVAGQASAGRKGLIGVGVTAPKTTSPISTTSTTSTTTTTATTPPPPVTTTTAPAGNPTNPAPGFPVGVAANGMAIFASSGCGGCHTLAAAGSSGSLGPNLDSAKPVIAQIEFQVKSGGLDMPSFASSLSDQQIADLATWVYQSTH